jgi:chemotaxis protein methyltransferase CheR
MQLRPGEMQLMRQMVLQLTGVALDDSKAYLVETRLARIAAEVGVINFNELYFRLRYARDLDLTQKVIEAITTHETSFFRDGNPFEVLQRALIPDVIQRRTKAGQRELRLWSAACSTGQEAYSMAMVLAEVLADRPGWVGSVVGTDISKRTLDQAARASYTPAEVARSARPAWTNRFLQPQDGGFRVIEPVRRLVSFREHNLLASPMGLGTFDVIFLRNVLIYFESETKREVVERVGSRLAPGGYLVVGATDVFSGPPGQLTSRNVSGLIAYQRPPDPLVLA